LIEKKRGPMDKTGDLSGKLDWGKFPLNERKAYVRP